MLQKATIMFKASAEAHSAFPVASKQSAYLRSHLQTICVIGQPPSHRTTPPRWYPYRPFHPVIGLCALNSPLIISFVYHSLNVSTWRYYGLIYNANIRKCLTSFPIGYLSSTCSDCKTLKLIFTYMNAL